MSKTKKAFIALTAAIMTFSSSAVVPASAENVTATVSSESASEKAAKEYSFDEVNSMTTEDVVNLFAEKGLTQENGYYVYGQGDDAEYVYCFSWCVHLFSEYYLTDKTAEEILTDYPPYPKGSCMYDKGESLWDSDRIVSSLALPEKYFEVTVFKNRVIVKDTNSTDKYKISCECEIRCKLPEGQERAAMRNAALNYLQLREDLDELAVDYAVPYYGKEKTAAQKYGEDIAEYMAKNSIQGVVSRSVPDEKLSIGFHGDYEDQVRAYIAEIGLDESGIPYELEKLPDFIGFDFDNTTGTTVNEPTEVTTTTTSITTLPAVLKGDANCDEQVDLADAVMIMQSLANPNKYGINGTAEHHLTEQGKLNGDMDGDGLTVGDALAIQRKLLGLDNGEITDSDRSAIAGKTFSYEKGGCGGEFTITFDEHGRFACHEKDILSFMTEGTWELNGDTVKLAYPVDESNEKAVYLKLNDSDLVYIGEKSDNFTSVKVQDGEKFTDTKIRNKVDWYDDYMISLKKDTDWSKNNKNLSAVIKDTDGLKSYLEQFCNEKAMSFYLDKYDDSFFKDNVLFMKWIFQGSGSAGPAYMVNVTMQPDNGLCMFVMYNGLLNGDSMASVCLAQVTVPKGIYDDNKEYNWNWVGYNVML